MSITPSNGGDWGIAVVYSEDIASGGTKAWPKPLNPTQEHIVERARSCLRRANGKEVSLTAISRAAHHSPSTLIYQFGSYAGLKDSIFTDIVLELSERVQRSMVDAPNPIDPVAAVVFDWVRSDPEAAEFVVAHHPSDLASAVSHRSPEPLQSIAGALLPSLRFDSGALDRSVPAIHQATNAFIRVAQAVDERSKLVSYLQSAVTSLDKGISLIA